MLHIVLLWRITPTHQDEKLLLPLRRPTSILALKRRIFRTISSTPIPSTPIHPSLLILGLFHPEWFRQKYWAACNENQPTREMRVSVVGLVWLARHKVKDMLIECISQVHNILDCVFSHETEVLSGKKNNSFWNGNICLPLGKLGVNWSKEEPKHPVQDLRHRWREY